MVIRLTKSRYLSGLQCHKRLWVEINAPDRIAPSSPSHQRLKDQGTEAGIFARGLFPSGVLIKGWGEDALAQTEQAIQTGVTCLFEAAFLVDGVFVRCDILQKLAETTWEIIEVKASTRIKEEYFQDLGIQQYVLTGAGLTVARVNVMYVNNQTCIYPNLSNLFSMEDVTETVGRLVEQIPGNLQKFREVLSGEEPEIAIGRHCDKPNACPLKSDCWKQIPRHSVYTIPRLADHKREDLLRQGIIHLTDLPRDFVLTKAQADYVERALNPRPEIDLEGIRTSLSTLKYPLHFFDFETCSPIIPTFEGLKPCSHFPFQYSCHVLQENGELCHYEYLHEDQSDPRPILIESLLNHIGETGSVIVYYATFERSRLQELAQVFPQYGVRLRGIIDRLWDQLDVFKHHYKHPDFNGSNSIKKVLPVLVPHLSYQNLGVQRGDDAQTAWRTLLKTPNPAERLRLLKDLREYCKMDTLAMVEIYKVLQQMVHPELHGI